VRKNPPNPVKSELNSKGKELEDLNALGMTYPRIQVKDMPKIWK